MRWDFSSCLCPAKTEVRRLRPQEVAYLRFGEECEVVCEYGRAGDSLECSSTHA